VLTLYGDSECSKAAHHFGIAAYLPGFGRWMSRDYGTQLCTRADFNGQFLALVIFTKNKFQHLPRTAFLAAVPQVPSALKPCTANHQNVGPKDPHAEP